MDVLSSSRLRGVENFGFRDHVSQCSRVLTKHDHVAFTSRSICDYIWPLKKVGPDTYTFSVVSVPGSSRQTSGLRPRRPVLAPFTSGPGGVRADAVGPERSEPWKAPLWRT